MNEEKYWNIAGLNICAIGSKEMVNRFSEQFLGCEINVKPDFIDIIIRIVSSLDECDFKPKYYSLSRSIQFNDKAFLKKTNQYIYVVKNLFLKDSITEIDIVDKEVIGIIEKIDRAKYGKDKSYWKCESYMNYGFMWMIFALSLQKKGKAFIHSSIVAIDKSAIAFCGTGGCGKTSTLFKLFERNDTSYLAEDFGILDENGIAYFNPKKIAIYASDIKYGQKDLVAYRRKMSGRDDLIWRMACGLGRNPRRKVNPQDVLGENRIEKEAKVSFFVFLAREECENTICEEANIDEIVYRITESSYRELKELFELLSNIHAIGGRNIPYPSIDELKLAHSEVIRCALENSKYCLCRVNKNASPDDILLAVSKWKENCR